MGEIFSPAAIRLASILAGMGAIVALFAAFLGGASWVTWLYRPLIAAFFMGLLGIGIHLLLNTVSPEIVKAFNDEENNAGENPDDMPSENIHLENAPADSLESGSEAANTEASDDAIFRNDTGSGMQQKSKKNVVAGQGEIVVEGVKLKNEPKVMAEAIKHLMDQDEDDS